jgi:hypothetical protein
VLHGGQYALPQITQHEAAGLGGTELALLRLNSAPRLPEVLLEMLSTSLTETPPFAAQKGRQTATSSATVR